MRQVLSITLLQFRLALKSKGTLAVVFGMPLLLTLIFGLLIGGGSNGSGGQAFPLAVVDATPALPRRSWSRRCGRKRQ